MSKIRKLFSEDIAYIIRYALNSISIYVDYRDEEKGRVLKKSKGPFIHWYYHGSNDILCCDYYTVLIIL